MMDFNWLLAIVLLTSPWWMKAYLVHKGYIPQYKFKRMNWELIIASLILFALGFLFWPLWLLAAFLLIGGLASRR